MAKLLVFSLSSDPWSVASEVLEADRRRSDEVAPRLRDMQDVCEILLLKDGNILEH